MVKVIPQEEIAERESFVTTFLAWFSILALMTTIVVFFLLNINVQKTNASLKTVEEELKKISTLEQQNLKKQAYDYKEKIDALPYLIQRHIVSSNAFSIIEKNVHPNVVFDSISLTLSDNKAILTGLANDMIDLAQQIRILEKEKPKIERVFLSNIDRSEEGKIKFKIEIYFNSSALIIQQ